MAIQDDHLRIVVQVPPQYSVAKVVQIFKGERVGYRGRSIRSWRNFCGETVFWADGYFAETVNQVNEEIVKNKSAIRQESHNQIMPEGRYPGL